MRDTQGRPVTGSNIKFPVAIPDLSGKEEEYVVDAIRGTWISSIGSYLRRFEPEFARLCGSPAAIAVSNGTVALHLAMAGLDVGPGDEVIVPSLTFIATANAVRYQGAEPTFVDVDPETWCLDPDQLERSITPRTRGVIPVHLYGHPADMDPILDVAGAHGIWVVEDAAEAHFARYKGKTVGSLGALATYSFYGNKPFTSGEGGAVTVNNTSLESKLRMLAGQGLDPARRYYFPIVGYNFRMTNIAAALLCAQMERKDEIIARRRQVFEDYRAALADVEGLSFQPVAPWAEPTPWLFSILVDEKRFGSSRDALAAALLDYGIDTRPFFIPVHRLPPYAAGSAGRAVDLPHSDALATSGLNLPTYSALTSNNVDEISGAIRAVARRR
jgi:perosamine synthetase